MGSGGIIYSGRRAVCFLYVSMARNCEDVVKNYAPRCKLVANGYTPAEACAWIDEFIELGDGGSVLRVAACGPRGRELDAPLCSSCSVRRDGLSS